MLQNKHVRALGAGKEHSGALSEVRRPPRRMGGDSQQDGSLYTWGCGLDGRLGLGDEYNRWHPTYLPLPLDRNVCRATTCVADTALQSNEVPVKLACGVATTGVVLCIPLGALRSLLTPRQPREACCCGGATFVGSWWPGLGRRC